MTEAAPVFAWILDGSLESASVDAPSRLGSTSPDLRLVPLDPPDPTRLRARVQGYDPMQRLWIDRLGFPGSTLHSRLKLSFSGKAFLFLGTPEPWKVSQLLLEDGAGASFLTVSIRKLTAPPRQDLAGALERLERGLRPGAPGAPIRLEKPLGPVFVDAEVLIQAYGSDARWAKDLVARLWKEQRGVISTEGLRRFLRGFSPPLDAAALEPVIDDLSRHFRVIVPELGTVRRSLDAMKSGLGAAEAELLELARQADAVEVLTTSLRGGRERGGIWISSSQG